MLLSSGSPAQTVRVTTVDLSAPVGADNRPGGAIEKAAQQIKVLSPQVVLVRGVEGWKMCSQLAEALKPADYRVVACSNFRSAGSSGAQRNQAGILAKNAAYFSWSEPWNFPSESPAAGGFAFAALQVGGHRFGFSVLELGNGRKPLDAQATRQWLETLNTFRAWNVNRLEGFVTGTYGLSEGSQLMRAADFVEPVMGKGQETIEAHLVPDADAPGGLVLSHWPVTCDFDFHSAPVIVVEAASRPSATATLFGAPAVAWWLGGGLILILVVIMVMQMGLRRKLARLQAQGALMQVGSAAHGLAPQSILSLAPGATTALEAPRILSAPERSTDHEKALRQGLASHLAEWFKHTFVQRLLSDREKLLVTQEAATKSVLAVDERLARLEGKIQEEIAMYQKQIEDLSGELLTAREENLELIRYQINLLKSRMETARVRVLGSEGR